MSDAELLQRYVREGADAAFAALAERYVGLVYSVARRHVGAAQAEDVAQAVFIELARRARDIKPGTPLIAWLHVVSRRLALNSARDAARRVVREQHAADIASMKSTHSDWHAVEPLLDEAVESLGEPDRTAILLRFFQSKSLRDVGLALGTTDDAAQKRVSRALEQLRAFFLRRGVTVTAVGLATELGAHALLTAPAGLLSTVTASSSIATTATATIAMTILQKSGVFLTVALLAGFGVYQASSSSRPRGGPVELNAQHGAIGTTQQPATAKLSPPAPPAASDTENTDTPSRRIALLKQLLTELPAQNLPETRLLTEEDWLAVARKHELDSAADIRIALAELRAIARRNFGTTLQDTLRDYTTAANGRWPENLAELAPLLTPPADAEMLARYEITREGAKKIIREKATSDLILTIDLDGFGLTNNSKHPLAFGESDTAAVQRLMEAIGTTLETGEDDQGPRAIALTAFVNAVGEAREMLGPNYGEEMKRAAAAFVATHPGDSLTNVTQVLPFLREPEKLIAAFRPVFAQLDYAREHSGTMPTAPEQFRSYLSRPFSPNEAFRVMRLTLEGNNLDMEFPFPDIPAANP